MSQISAGCKGKRDPDFSANSLDVSVPVPDPQSPTPPLRPAVASVAVPTIPLTTAAVGQKPGHKAREDTQHSR